MFATVEVVQKAIAAGANFIIAHEPTFYNHADDTEWLQHDAVYNYKRDLLQRQLRDADDPYAARVGR